MKSTKWIALALGLSAFTATVFASGAPSGGFYNQGVSFYSSGRFSEATDSFELAVKKHDREKESQDYIDRIRKETVERIRNKALTGVSKANWQTKYYYITSVDNRIRVGISAQEVFERESLNYRPGAIDALALLAASLAKADTSRIDVELINEINQETIPNPDATTQQRSSIFSYLSLAARGALPKYQ